MGDVGAHGGHLTRPFQPDRRTDAAQGTVRVAGRHGQLGPVQPSGVHPDKDLVHAGNRGRNVPELKAVLGDDHGAHAVFAFGSGPGPGSAMDGTGPVRTRVPWTRAKPGPPRPSGRW